MSAAGKTPRYSIGIDLGTTNSALAAVPLGEAAPVSRILRLNQWESASALTESPTLPSFLYLPTASEASQLRGKIGGGDWIVGKFARGQAVKTPGRVIHSTKSWLCAHGVDRSAAFLPWGSQDLESAEKLSPIRASALLLNYLKSAWDDHLTPEDGEDARFNRQEITITVPASFDAAAQRLTLEAAKEAGFPDGVKLLEEPQAAFYCWLEAHETVRPLEETLPALKDRPQQVIIVDIGGGTTDFSRFEIRPGADRSRPEIKRVAVSDHILLGGDNIDLAIAHLLEPQLTLHGELSADQWGHLVARCRQLKEDALEDDRAPEETYTVAIPGRGSSLLAGTLTARVEKRQLLELLLEGFYPACAADTKPTRTSAALREWGLPYAADSAITHHLAEFLHGRPPIDAVLFNGGSLKPEPLRQRLREQIAAWQGGKLPIVLDNPEPDLAVARGAARYGWLLRHNAKRIHAGSARSVYLKAQTQGEEDDRLVCILPRGTAQEEEVTVDQLNLRLRVNQPVQFQVYSTTRRELDRAGQVVPLTEEEFTALPPLQTMIDLKGGAGVVPVTLNSKLNAVGLLQVACVQADRPANRWPLEFSLRQKDNAAVKAPEGVASGPGVSEEALQEAEERIRSLFQNPWNRRDQLTPARLVKSLEKILNQPKHEWNAILLRSLWPVLYESFAARGETFDHEESWVSFAGLILRPGYGVQMDAHRIDQLWEFHEDGFWYPGKAMQVNADVLWRRVAGGLSQKRQTALVEETLPRIRQTKNPSPEAVRLMGALERVDQTRKQALADLFLELGAARARDGGYADPFFVSLTRLLNRAPLYAGPETVLPPEYVERAFEKLEDLDWTAQPLAELTTLFLRAGRMVDNRSLDLPKELRRRITAKLRDSDVAPGRLEPLERLVKMERADQVSLFGESLPPGLVLE